MTAQGTPAFSNSQRIFPSTHSISSGRLWMLIQSPPVFRAKASGPHDFFLTFLLKVATMSV
jgi:hypothetical protein